ncbi:MAG: hypothetical protein PVI40_05180 [Chlamydiota bacterium]|jgi:hypothetical protein
MSAIHNTNKIPIDLIEEVFKFSKEFNLLSAFVLIKKEGSNSLDAKFVSKITEYCPNY